MDNQLLFSPEIEQSVIGWAIIHPDEIERANLTPDDFYVHRNRMIWEAIARLKARGMGVDFVTISEELNQRGQLKEIGGQAGLAGYIAIDYSLNIETCSKTIRDYAARRRLLDVAGDIARLAQNKKADVNSEVGGLIERLSKTLASDSSAKHWAQYLSDLYEDVLERSKNPKDAWGIPTGLPTFDRHTGGLQKSESVVLSGKPGVGKSILAMQIGRGMAAHEPGVIYSIEMKGRQVARRFVSAASGVQSSKLKSGRLAGEDWPRVTDAIQRLSALPVFMSDAPGWTTAGLRADLARLKATCGIGWFVLDYLMLLSDAPNLDRTERSEMISRNLKLICRDLDLAGLTVHSMNKAGIDASAPGQSSLAGSAQVAFDADLICILTEFQCITSRDGFIPTPEQKNMRTLIFAKGRELESQANSMHLVKIPNLPEFGDYMPEPGRYS